MRKPSRRSTVGLGLILTGAVFVACGRGPSIVGKEGPPEPPRALAVVPEATAADGGDFDRESSNRLASGSDAGLTEVQASHDSLERLLRSHPDVTTLDGVPALLPRSLRRSFVLKHGIGRKGERGHLVETRVSQSADPDAPRVIAWDDKTGFVVSYNGGTEKQTNGQRLDLHGFDATTNAFTLEAIDFPIAPGQPRFASQGCENCHGKHARPIFSMYPDWPGFYGSDNDELGRSSVPTQVAELADYTKLRSRVPSLPRYAPLFSEADTRERFDRPLWETFPYRPDTRDDIHSVSRAFAFRPGLRLGLLLARLQARALVARVTKHPRYAKLGRLFLSTLLECKLSSHALERAKTAVREALHEEPKLVGGQLHERQAWRLFDLEIRDVDLRYSVNHEGNASDDASKNPMSIGYIGTYWSSYFDGSATLDELVSYGLFVEESRARPELATLVTPNGLRKKYEHLTERYRIDAELFDSMDRLGQWIPIPYPSSLTAVHHREGFGKAYRDEHQALCGALVATLE